MDVEKSVLFLNSDMASCNVIADFAEKEKCYITILS